MSAFIDLLRNGIVLGDGALGTLLHQRGQPLNACYDVLNLTQAESVQQVHREYLEAGARLLATNTFGASRLKLEKFGLASQLAAINRRGAELAVELARPRGAFVAGSVGPLASDPSITLDDATRSALYGEQCEALLSGGVDVLLLETFPRLADLVVAVRAARGLGAAPIIARATRGGPCAGTRRAPG